MLEKVVKHKVLVYVVRDGHLLVFRHLDYSFEEVGIQVPGGGIRVGESPETAALREVREETGLTDFEIVRKLGETEYDISPYRHEIQHRHVFHLALREEALGGPARKTTTGKARQRVSSAFGFRWRERTSSNLDREP